MRSRIDPFTDFFTREGPVIKTCTRNTANVVNALLKYSKEKVSLKCNIRSSFDRTILLTNSLIRMITTPFHTLHLVFSSMEKASSTCGMSLNEKMTYTSVFETNLFTLGSSIAFLKFELFMRIEEDVPIMLQAPYDISCLLYGILLASQDPRGQDNSTQILGIMTTCKFNAKSMLSFLMQSPRLKELRIQLPCESLLERLRMIPDTVEEIHVPSIVDGFQSPEEKRIPINALKLLRVASRLRKLVTLNVCLSLDSLKGTEIAVRTLFSKLTDMSLIGGEKDVTYWRSVFRLLAQTKNSLRRLCLSSNVLGGESLKITTSPVYYPKSKSNESSHIKQSLEEMFDWMPEALALSNLGSTCCIRESAIEEFLSVLQNMKNLEEIDLSSTNLVPVDIIMIANDIVSCPHLKVLELSRNNIGNSCSALCKSLVRFRELTALHLSHCKLRNKGLNMLVPCFSGLTSLKALYLSENMITLKGTYTLSKELRHLPNLLTLDVSCNPIGDLGVLALCAALRYVPELRCLGLRDCAITCSGVLLLTQSFKILPCLEYLQLGENAQISHDGITWLFESVGCLPKVTEVNLRGIIKLTLSSHHECLRKWFEELKWARRKSYRVQEDDDGNEDDYSFPCFDDEKEDEEQVCELQTLTGSEIHQVLG